jgi:hypothetical protein
MVLYGMGAGIVILKSVGVNHSGHTVQHIPQHNSQAILWSDFHNRVRSVDN